MEILNGILNLNLIVGFGIAALAFAVLLCVRARGRSKNEMVRGGAELPNPGEHYKTAGPFEFDRIPSGLRAAHSTRQGTWGEIVCDEGALVVVWEDTPGPRTVTLRAGSAAVMRPGERHHVSPATEKGSMRVCFWRSKG